MAEAEPLDDWFMRVANALKYHSVTQMPHLDVEWLVGGLDAARGAGSVNLVAGDLCDFARERPGVIADAILEAVPVTPTSSFNVHLLRLEAFVRGLRDAPQWGSVLVSSTLISDGSPRGVDKNLLLSPRSYTQQFERLLSFGFAWINLHAAGLLRDTLLIEVEHAALGRPGRSSSVNLSGPVNWVRARDGWDLSGLIECASSLPRQTA